MYRFKYLLIAAAIGTSSAIIGCTTTTPQASAQAEEQSEKEFTTIDEDGRLWVFRAGSEELDHFRKDGELAKHVIRPRSGPNGETLKAPDGETIDAYLASPQSKAPRFVTIDEDGRLWVFRAGSEELDHFRKDGELAKHVIRPRSGPNGETLKAPDSETIDAYLAAVR